MALRFLSPPPPLSLITCHATTPSAVRISPPQLSVQSPPPPPPSPQPLSLPLNPNATTIPSVTCALHCFHFQSCSGCTHEYNLHHPVIVDEAATFFKNLGVSDFKFDTCRLWGWRCRAKLAIRGSSRDPLIGLYREGTHDVIDIPDCKAHHPNINAAVELLRQGIVELNVEPYDEDQGTGELRYVQMAVTTYNTSLPAAERYSKGKVQVALVWNSRSENSPSFDKLNALAKVSQSYLWRNGGPTRKVQLIHSVWANFQTSTNNIIFGNRWRHLLGERDFWEHVGGIDVSLTPSSFGQANTRAFDSLLRKLHKHVPLGSSVADLYAGAGVIGLSLASTRKCRQERVPKSSEIQVRILSVKCIEINKESKLSFEKTAERLPHSVDSSISWHQADTSIDPISWFWGSDVIVVDPPRKGLDPNLVDALCKISALKRSGKSHESTSPKTKDEKRPWILRAKEAAVQIQIGTPQEESQSLPQTLIYISCGWESFKEDCMSLLSSKAWHLDKAHGFNFFPGTQSIEILAVFKRGPGVKKKKSGKKKKKPCGKALKMLWALKSCLVKIPTTGDTYNKEASHQEPLLLQHENKLPHPVDPYEGSTRHPQPGSHCVVTSTILLTFSTPRRVTTAGLTSTSSPTVIFLIHGSGFASKKGSPLRSNIISYMLGLKQSPTVLAIRRTSMVMGSKRRLLVSSRNITHRETVILIEPAIREAAPRTA
ncbi:hypothetical protein RJ639_033077 [Escallonia herrerae]|uniref:Methyltransferase small domain-containing protein n=1 Tax=Escallonia herrerae TaxID=1293975 RepID=A0AA88WYE7_9ASTE|nr:hypothetical protein RJ639_033077 [Escallonia herrerae]